MVWQAERAGARGKKRGETPDRKEKKVFCFTEEGNESAFHIKRGESRKRKNEGGLDAHSRDSLRKSRRQEGGDFARVLKRTSEGAGRPRKGALTGKSPWEDEDPQGKTAQKGRHRVPKASNEASKSLDSRTKGDGPGKKDQVFRRGTRALHEMDLGSTNAVVEKKLTRQEPPVGPF